LPLEEIIFGYKWIGKDLGLFKINDSNQNSSLCSRGSLFVFITVADWKKEPISLIEEILEVILYDFTFFS
jgi:hypothetical protein